MKETILIFSATKHLFETTVSWEARLLLDKYNVVILSEYCNIPPLDGAIMIQFYKPSKIKGYLPVIRSFHSVLFYKNLSSQLIKEYQIKAIIIHQDVEFYTNYFIRCILDGKKIKVIMLRPSVVIFPQKDFSWQRELISKNLWLAPLKFFLIKFYFDIFLSILFTGKSSITRLAFWPTNSKFWFNKKERIYDISLCYSNLCKENLSTIYEDSQVIMNPLAKKYHYKLHLSISSAVLFIPSNDIWAVMSAKNFTSEEAKNYVNDKINEVAKTFVQMGIEFHIRYKEGEGDISFFDDEIKNYVRLVENKQSLYEQVKGYSKIAGFVTTALWLMAIYQSPHQIYSFQLIDTDFYNYYRDFPGVCFVEMHKDRYELDSAVYSAEYSCRTFQTIEYYL